MIPEDFDPTAEEATPNPPRYLTLAGVGLGAAGALVYLATLILTGENGPSAIGYALGLAVGTIFRAVVLGLILCIPAFWLINKVRKTAPPGLAALVIGLWVLLELGYRSGVVVYKAAYVRQVVQDMQAAADQIRVNPTGAIQVGSGSSEFSRWFDSYLSRNQAIQADLQAAMGRYGLPTMLSPETFRTAESITAARKNAAGFFAELDVSLGRYERLLEDADKEVAALKMPEEFKASILRGMRETAPQTRVLVRNHFDVQKNFMLQCDGLLAFMGQLHPAGYQIEGQQIIFATQADVDEYNTRMEAIRATAQKEQETLRAISQQFESYRQKLAELAGQ